MDECKVRPCKFGGAVECTWSDRGRADCYVCGAVRSALSTLSRLQWENFALTTRVRELEAEIQVARDELVALQGEQEKVCRALGVSWKDILTAV